MNQSRSESSQMIITKTPFRISFFGGGTDFKDYFQKHTGLVIGTAINKYCYVVINTLERLLDKKIRMSAMEMHSVDSVEDLTHDITRCILKELDIKDKFIDLHTFADLPASSGVGSSSAYTVGLINAINLIYSKYQSPYALAKKAIHIEREKLKHRGGWQDQIFSAFGGFVRIYFSESNFEVEPLCLKKSTISLIEDSCLLVFTGLTRSSHEAQKGLIECDKNKKYELLSKIHNCAKEADKLLTTKVNNLLLIKKLGELLHESWLVKRSLDSKITNPIIEEIYERGIKAGAFGGKLCGAGSGGFILFMVNKDTRKKVIHELNEFKHMKFKIAHEGSCPIYNRHLI